MDFALVDCARHGHATYRPTDDDALADRLHSETADGEAWRCLRCGDFALGAPARSGPVGEAPVIHTGRSARDHLIVRLLAVERIGRALVFALLAYGVHIFAERRADLGARLNEAIPALKPFTDQIDWNPDTSSTLHFVYHLIDEPGSKLSFAVLGLAAVAVAELVEAVGLWLEARWGEYYAVVITAALIPWEAYELVDKPTALKVGGMIVNIAAVVWLVWTKHLFGANGGGAAVARDRRPGGILGDEFAASRESASAD